MSSTFRPWPAPATRCAVPRRFRRAVIAAAAALLVQGCAKTPPRIFEGANAADAGVRVPPARYSPAVSGYVSQRPAGPAPWAERNRQVTPPPEKGGQ